MVRWNFKFLVLLVYFPWSCGRNHLQLSSFLHFPVWSLQDPLCGCSVLSLFLEGAVSPRKYNAPKYCMVCDVCLTSAALDPSSVTRLCVVNLTELRLEGTRSCVKGYYYTKRLRPGRQSLRTRVSKSCCYKFLLRDAINFPPTTNRKQSNKDDNTK